MKISMIISDGAYSECHGTFEYPCVPPVGTIIQRGTEYMRVVNHHIILTETPVGYKSTTSVRVEDVLNSELEAEITKANEKANSIFDKRRKGK